MNRRLRLISIVCISFAVTACWRAAPAPIPTPSPVSPEAFDLQLQREAMLPAYASDVDRQATATRYRLRLQIDPATTQVNGHEDVQFTNAYSTPLNEIYFRLFAVTPGYGGLITVTQTTLDNQLVQPSLEQEGSALRVPLTQPLQPGRSITLSLDFRVDVPRDNEAGYAQLDSTDDTLTLPNIYPIIPAYDEEGWHIEMPPTYGDAVYSETALYEVEIDAPSGILVTTGSCQPPQSISTGLRWECASGPARDFMLALVSRYEVATQDVDGVTVRSFYLPQHAIAGKLALQYAARAVELYSQRFGPYRFAQLDIVETPTTAGGIEYPGMVAIATRMYNNPQESFEWVVAHETAHQWWYSMIGVDLVNHPWLDEALAQYSTILYYEDAHDKATASYLLNAVLEQPYESVIKKNEDAPVDQPVKAFTPQSYSVIVYDKGPLFFDALRQAMGDDKFDTFLRTYYRQNLYGVATPERLLDAAYTVLDKTTVQRLYDEWIKGVRRP